MQYNTDIIKKESDHMENSKQIVAQKIHDLRVVHKLTQTDLADRLNYSDKAISKWERAESMPDVAVLVQIADRLGVSMDELFRDNKPPQAPPKADKNLQHGLIIGMSLLLVWLIATFVFIVLVLTGVAVRYCWLAFLFAVPVSMIVWLVLNSVWFDRRRNYLIISLLMWSVLASIYLCLLPFGYQIWLIFLLGVPGQIIILLWSGLRPKKKQR